MAQQNATENYHSLAAFKFCITVQHFPISGARPNELYIVYSANIPPTSFCTPELSSNEIPEVAGEQATPITIVRAMRMN